MAFFLSRGTGCACRVRLVTFHTATFALVAAVYRFGVISAPRHVLLAVGPCDEGKSVLDVDFPLPNESERRDKSL